MTKQIRGYTLLQDFTTAGAGQCMWTFATREGREYFLKKFLAPTYPVPGSPGSETVKRAKLARCDAFERHHNDIVRALEGLSADGGNLVVTHEFFKEGAKYYKSTAKVDVATTSVRDISRMSLDQKLLVLVTVSHSLRILHSIDLVHGDLSPNNILLKTTASGGTTTKLIDFDNAFFAKRPPPPEELVGNIVYYSPELLAYITDGGSAEQLGVASDIYALGLIFTQYLTGGLPRWDSRRHRYAAVATRTGAEVSVAGLGLPGPLERLLHTMLSASPEARPSIGRIYDAAKYLRKLHYGDEFKAGPDADLNSILGLTDTADSSPRAASLRGKLRVTSKGTKPTAAPASSAGLRGSLRGAPREHVATPDAAESPPSKAAEMPRLKGSLLRRASDS